MDQYPYKVMEKLDSILRETDKVAWLFSRTPEKDFSRHRKLPFHRLCKILIGMEGNSLSHEMLNCFHFSRDTPTVSALVQQRTKLLPEAMAFVFSELVKAFPCRKTLDGYRLIACDGSDLHYAANPLETDNFFQTDDHARGYNLLHLNVLYDVCSRRYTDFFYCVASSASADSATSDVAALTVSPQPVVAITSQPVSMSFAEGDASGSLSIAANASDGSTLGYQWYSNTENSNTGGTLLEGETAATYQFPTDLSIGSYYYYCVVTGGSAVVASEPATVTVRAAVYLARYTLTGEADTATPASIADESGNANAALSILGVSAYDASGRINLNGTAGNGLQVEGLNLNGSTSYKLHTRFVSKDRTTGVGDGTSHRLLYIPDVDFNLMLVAGGSSSDCMKLETTNENYTTQTSTNTPSGIRRPTIAILDIDVRVANDVVTIAGSGESFAGLPFTMTLSNVSIPGFTAALSNMLYVGNRADGTRPVNGSVTEVWIQETAFVSLSFTTQPVDARYDLGNVTGSLSALAAASNSTNLTYQWYSNTVNSTTGGAVIEGATGTSYALPADLTKGAHYYYCVATSETAGTVHSSCATVTVVAYIAKYALKGAASTGAPATIADSSGNNNAAIAVNGVTTRDEHGRMMLTETGQSLYLPSIANLPANYKLHIRRPLRRS